MERRTPLRPSNRVLRPRAVVAAATVISSPPSQPTAITITGHTTAQYILSMLSGLQLRQMGLRALTRALDLALDR